MKTILIIMVVAAALATLFILIRGVVTMANGQDITGERSQALMRKRILFQAVTIILAVILLLVFGNSR